MFYALSSYSAGSYEAYWKDVLVLEEVAEAVAAELNADLGTSTVDAGELAAVLKDVVLPGEPQGQAETGAEASPGGLGALRTMDTASVGAAARALADRLLDPVQGEAMVASAAEAAQTGVSGLSVAMAVAVVETLGAKAEGPGTSGPGLPAAAAETTQTQAIERLQDASVQAWGQLGDAASLADVGAMAASAQTVVTVSKALELLSTGVVDTAPVSVPARTAAPDPLAPSPPSSPAPEPPAALPLWAAAGAALPPAPVPPAPEADPLPAAPPAPAKRFVWVVKQVLAWRWRERLVTVVRESAPAHQALDDRKQQELEHAREDRRHLRWLELQALSRTAARLAHAAPEPQPPAVPAPRGPA